MGTEAWLKYKNPQPVKEYLATMKLVMEYHDTDGCTYNCTLTVPFHGESPEAALVQFEDLLKKRHKDDKFQFCGLDFYGSEFDLGNSHSLPNFFTLEEWFERGAVNQ